MRLKPVLVSGLVLSLTAFPAYAGDFEGVIQMKNSHVDTGTTSIMNWYIKGDRGRVEMSRTDNQTQVMLFDGKTRTMQMGMPGQKSYMEISLEGDRGDHLKELLDTQSVERTGKTPEISARCAGLPTRSIIAPRVNSVWPKGSERPRRFGSIPRKPDVRLSLRGSSN